MIRVRSETTYEFAYLKKKICAVLDIIDRVT